MIKSIITLISSWSTHLFCSWYAFIHHKGGHDLEKSKIRKSQSCESLSDLEQLSYYIERAYSRLPDIFPSLTVTNVKEIQNGILTGEYCFSAQKLLVFENRDSIKEDHIYNFLIDNKHCYGCLYQIPSDKLVVLGLGYFLNCKINDFEHLNERSFGFRSAPSDYYEHIISSIKEPVSRVYKFDMTNSLRRIETDLLLTKLECIVEDVKIMTFIRSALNRSPILTDGCLNITIEGLPSYGFFTDVLLNFSLIDLDMIFPKLFPSFTYARYVHEIIVTTSEVDPSFSDSVFELFDRLNLAGKVLSISPGDQPLNCHHGGLVWVSEDGRINIKKERE